MTSKYKKRMTTLESVYELTLMVYEGDSSSTTLLYRHVLQRTSSPTVDTFVFTVPS